MACWKWLIKHRAFSKGYTFCRMEENSNFVCPHCGESKYYFILKRKQYECTNTNCRRQTPITKGTFLHKSRIPLRKWFLAICIFADNRKITAAELSRKLELSKPTAKRMLNIMLQDSKVLELHEALEFYMEHKILSWFDHEDIFKIDLQFHLA